MMTQDEIFDREVFEAAHEYRQALAITRLASLVSARTSIDNQITTTVRHARTLGVTWQEIANTLGITHRQSAQRKYGKKEQL